MEAELAELGLATAGATVKTAQERSYSPDGVRKLIAYYQTHSDRWRTVGVVAMRIKNSPCTMPPERGWPDGTQPKSKPTDDAERMRRLESLYKGDVQRMKLEHVAELAKRAGVERWADIPERGYDAVLKAGGGWKKLLLWIAENPSVVSDRKRSA